MVGSLTQHTSLAHLVRMVARSSIVSLTSAWLQHGTRVDGYSCPCDHYITLPGVSIDVFNQLY
jgi:hypothetical protein